MHTSSSAVTVVSISNRKSVFDPSEDEGLVARMRGGDRAAEENFYRRHAHAVNGTVVRMLGHRHDAEEVVQETFIEALQNIASLRDPRAARAWVMRIAIHKVQRRLRRQRLLRIFGFVETGADLLLAKHASPEVSPEQRSELMLLDEVLRTLSPNDRIAWVLRFVEGEKLEDVAELCECSLATAKRRIAAADAVIRRHVSFEDGGAR